MRRTWPTLAVMASLLLSPLAVRAPFAQTPGAVPTGRVIVKFKANAELLKSESTAQALGVTRGASRAASLAQRTGLALSSGARLDERMQVMRATGVDSRTLAARLAAQPDVEYAVPDERARVMVAPNDPRYASVSGNGPAAGQWYLRAPSTTLRSAINAEAAWDVSTGSNSVVVAVLDTGVRYDHEDLKTVANGGNLLPGYDMVADVAAANDGDGRDADPSDPGDFVTSADVTNLADCEPGDESDSSWHGTQTSSLIGALTDNGIGMASVGRNLRVLPIRVLGKCGGFNSDIILGMRWAAGLSTPEIAAVNPVANRAKVINMSLGGSGTCSAAYQDTINELTTAGVVVVASAGNSAGHAIAQPANCSGVIAVAGLRHLGTKVGFSDIGTQVTLAAPGGNCVTDTGNCQYPIITAINSGTTVPVAGAAGSRYTDGVNYAVGTSFSAPLVAGTVGLMFSVRPALTSAEVKAALQGTARSFPNSGADSTVVSCKTPTTTDQLECYCTTSTCGAGMLDTGAAVTAANRGSQARVTASDDSPAPNVLLTLSGASSFLVSGRTVASYQWALVDGGGIVTTLASSSGATATLTPTGSGRFSVSLAITDSAGQQSTTVRAFDVQGSSTPGTGTTPGQTQPSGGGGGALGVVWLVLLGAAVVALQGQAHRARGRRG
jgi:serine protease